MKARKHKQRQKAGILVPVYLPVMLLLLLNSSRVGAEASSPPSIGILGGPLFAITVSSDSAQSVYMGTGQGVYKSVYGEDLWRPVSEGLSSSYAYELVLTAVTGTQLYCATKDGVAKSTDGGVQWTAAGLAGHQVFSLAIHPVTQTYLAAGTPEGVFTSTNAGTSWAAEPSGPLNVNVIAFSPDTHAAVYAGTIGSGIYTSTDFGSTWTKTGSGPENVKDIAIDPSVTSRLYAATAAGLFKSTNTGTTWSLLSGGGIPSGPIYSTAMPSLDGATMYAATDSGVFKTTNNGVDWTRINTGIQTAGSKGPFARVVSIDPSDATRLYVGTYSGDNNDADIYRSTNSGASWTQINRELSNTVVLALAFDTVSDTPVVYAGTSSIGVLKSTNGGLSWQESNKGITNYRVRALSVNPETAAVYAGTSSGLYISTDSGGEWSEASANHDVYSIGVDPLLPENLYIGTNQGLFLSTDDGTSWVSLNNDLPNPYTFSLAFDPENEQTLYAGTDGDGIFKSTSAGARWIPVNEGVDSSSIYCLGVSQLDTETVFAGTKNGGLFKSTDGGARWQSAGPYADTSSVRSLSLNPLDASIVYAGLEDAGIYRTTDGAQTWEMILQEDSVIDKTVYAMSLEPGDPQTLFAGVQGDVAVFTFNDPPETPYAPLPADYALNQPITATVRWSCADPDAGDTLSFAVLFGSDPETENNTASTVSAAEYSPGTLQLSTTYYWRVTAMDAHGGETQGPVWRFSTAVSNPPNLPSDPQPADGTENQNWLLTLEWSGGDPDSSDTVAYDVYLGTTETPRLKEQGLTETAYTLSKPLLPNTTYYWKVIARDNNQLETAGPVWSFTTALIPEDCYAEALLHNDPWAVHVLRRFKKNVLQANRNSRQVIACYYVLSPFLVRLLTTCEGLQEHTLETFRAFLPVISHSSAAGRLVLTPEQAALLRRLYGRYVGCADKPVQALLLSARPYIDAFLAQSQKGAGGT